MTTHLSVRLTWHDNGWNGCVCKSPAQNTSCVAHEHVREARNLDYESQYAEQPLHMLPDKLPPCSRDTGAYGETGYQIQHRDPVIFRGLPAPAEVLPPYTCCPSPYRWMREENLRDVLEAERFQLRPSDDAKRSAGWVTEPDRQIVLLSKFWGKLEQKKSLVFYYCNQANPLSEDHARILVGVGRIHTIAEQLYFGKKKGYEADHPIWSRAITQNFPAEGVRIPYQAYLEQGNSVEQILCPVPGMATSAFSYVGEHVSDDTALAVIEHLIQSIQQVQSDGFVPGDWARQLEWLDQVLAELWQERGAFPGIGSVLQTLGFSQGMAYQRFVLAPLMRQQQNIWEHLEKILNGQATAEAPYEEGLKLAATNWQKLPARQALLRQLARFELTAKQVERIMNPTLRAKARITATPDELIANPYLIYEQDVGDADSEAVTLDAIDHGMLPQGYAALFQPQPMLTTDARRVRALATDVLRSAAQAGHSLLGVHDLIERIGKRFTGQRACHPDLEILAAEAEYYEQILTCHFSEEPAWVALKPLHQQEQKIAEMIRRRVKRHNKVTWDESFWYQKLIQHPKIGQPQTEREQLAIQEKLAALRKLFEQRVCVLTGGAGTGKTTVLKVFIDALQELEGQQPLLLLAPTGKARVRLSSSTQRNAFTIHQFLLKQGWYDPALFILNPQSVKPSYDAKTVVVDECSMIPSDLFGTLVSALNTDAMSRLILVGDPNQLPPIGPGKPFADMITWLEAYAAHAVARLETCMRTVDGDQSKISVGLEFANSYRPNDTNPADDELLSELAQGKTQGDLNIVFWQDPADLQTKLAQCLQDYLNIAPNDYTAFSDSLGFKEKNWSASENWQILSPTRRDGVGTEELNRLIQLQYKGGLLSKARNPRERNHYKFGDAELLWSDKVIQVRNESRKAWPAQTGLDYVANGEIGLIERTGKSQAGSPYLQVYYSTQSQVSYRYYINEVSGLLELAYALTVHKAQGSDFETVFLIIPQQAQTLSRELIYTGLTRFRKRLVLLVEKDIQPLLRLRQSEYSDVEQRNSYVFDLILKAQAIPTYLSEYLIHRAQDGTRMRSKSEVIVANTLLNLGLTPRYEQPLSAPGNPQDFRLPDFTIHFEGDTYYWEHLGMLSLPSYREKWERKKQWYQQHGFWSQVITSEDSPEGGIDTLEIQKIARQQILLEDD